MPARTYRGTVTPPRWWEKGLAHPLEVVIALMGLAFGAMLASAQVWQSYDPSPPVAELPAWQGWLMALSLLGGATFMLASLLGPMPDLEAEWLVERVGLALSSTAWLSYAGAVYIAAPEYGGALVLGLGLGLGLAARLAVTFVIQIGVERISAALRRGPRE